MKTFPSIFNDVIGPVMRGPSSSHCAASVRIGRIARDLMNCEITDVIIEFDKNGSLATTHKSQGSDMGLFAGLLGWDATDDRLTDSEKHFKESGINIKFKISDKKDIHPNTYNLKLKNKRKEHNLIAISIGGGSIQIIAVDDFKTSLHGDIYTTLIFADDNSSGVLKYLHESIQYDEILLHKSAISALIELRTTSSLPDDSIKLIHNNFPKLDIIKIDPVFPVISKYKIDLPFSNCEEMLIYNKSRKLDLWELAIIYECERGGLTENEVLNKMQNIITILDNSVEQGIKGTSYSDRIIGYQSGKFNSKFKKEQLQGGEAFNRIILYVTALMEVKSSMGLIVAAPTAGSCGGLPGAVLGIADSLGLSTLDKTKAMLSAGLIGVFIADQSTFAAETCGCQAECGSGSGMAAAALVSIMGGTVNQALSAASMAIQNTLGMICDPVANRVEVPCLGKNVMAATNALSCANMALAGFDEVIPLSQVIETMDRVGKSIPRELRCTGLGGLSITKASKDIEKRLLSNND
ncbi:L-serine ammonia-lyase, iron-sulfur-dependent, subunit alpha [Bacteroidota bacterium]